MRTLMSTKPENLVKIGQVHSIVSKWIVKNEEN